MFFEEKKKKNGNVTFKRARPPGETEVWKTST